MSEQTTNQQQRTDPGPVDDTGSAWFGGKMDGRPVRSWIGIGLAIALVTLGFGAFWTYGLGNQAMEMGEPAGQAMTGQQPGGMGQMNADVPRVPPVLGYYAGEQVFFVHTEASDPKIAQVLEGMMGSPVPVVTSLAQVPEEALGDVYVFTNGVTPGDTPAGPLGFQPDVFDSAPGDEEYTPLRRVVEATWSDESQAQVLTSVEQITEAESAGQLTLEPTDVVVNAPLLTWPRGQR